MTFDELVKEVYTITNRPNLSSETILATKSAILKIHGLDFWGKDLQERKLVFSASQMIQQLPLASLPRHRIFQYIRIFDPTAVDPYTNQNTGWPKDFFKMIPADKVLDTYNLPEPYKYYISSGNVNLFAPVAFQQILVGYYNFPVLSPTDQFQSWIVDGYSPMIAAMAAETILGGQGDVEAARRVKAIADSLLQTFITNNTEAQAR